MKRNFLILVLCVFVAFSCSKKEDAIQQEDLAIQQESSNSGSKLKSGAGGIKGVNWADARDNYNSGWVLPSGISSGDSYTTIKSNAQTICTNLGNITGCNTIRIPINPPTVMQWWGNYKGTIDGALAAGKKVIIGCWTESNTIGYVTNWNNFISMWTTVTNEYKNNSNVYFEILNEPYSYSTTSLLQMYGSWLSIFSSVTRGRVLCGGTGYCDNVKNIGGSSTISGCLLSQHIYSFWGTNSVVGWQKNLSGRIGSYASRTIVTEFGVTLNSGLNFYGTSSTDNQVYFFQGIANQCRGYGISCVYWPGLRDGDGYSMTTRNSDFSLNTINSSAVNELKYAYN